MKKNKWEGNQIEDKIKRMTLREKIAFCSGEDAWSTKAMPKYQIPSMKMTDGPHGLRLQVEASDMMGINRSVPATCFPTAALTACSFDESLLAEIGEAIAREAASHGVGMILGPGANLKRNPLCGRNFEYFSEDPYLAGKLAAAYIRGAQGTGVCTSLKHFACNSQEYSRFSSDSIVDERTMRELYLAAFELAVKEGRPSTVMCAYNKINGVHCSDSKVLLSEILRKDWGFDGMVVTDWGAMSNRLKGFCAGCDLSMPGGSAYMEAETAQAVEKGVLKEAFIDRSASRVLRVVEQGTKAVAEAKPVDMQAHYDLARRAAAESAVLLKNEDAVLPLRGRKNVALIGDMAKNLRYQGSGSSHINPWKLTSVLEAWQRAEEDQPSGGESGITDAVSDPSPRGKREAKASLLYAQGCSENGETTKELLREAVETAKKADVAVVFAGLIDQYESEGFDRDNMKMPAGHNRLIEAVAAANPNTVVVLLCGSAVELPWADKVKAILYMGLSGEAGGDAICDLLLGRAVPCGKLAESWPYKYEDCVSAPYYVKGRKDGHYREGLYVGYRYYTSAHVPVRFPFGYGLSYTTFSYSDLKIQGTQVSCKVKNTGSVAGKEVAQLYLAPPKGPFYRPVRELKGFQKIFLQPGQEKTITFSLSDRSFALWNDGWVIPDGRYTILVGGSSEDLPLSGSIERKSTDGQMEILERPAGFRTWQEKENGTLTSAAPILPDWYREPKGSPSHADFEALVGHAVGQKPLKKGEFTMENSVMEMQEYSLVMKIMYKAVGCVIAKGIGGKVDETDPTFRMMMNSAVGASLSGMRINSGMKNYVIEGLLEMANGHYLAGLVKMCSRVKS